jgi:predicted aminopeptidase
MSRSLALLLCALSLLGGCAASGGLAPTGSDATPEPQSRRWVLEPGYYWQSVQGHLGLMRATRKVDDWLQDPATPDRLRQRLVRAQEARAFATGTLLLPSNASYTRYADLGRRAVLWNVVAAPPHRLELQEWCFPFAGCVGYRGYYDEQAARAFAAGLPPGMDVAVYPVHAYSTLGWLNWLGGDPLLNTFIHYPEVELARLLFHELAHQKLFLPGDTAFNESFASAVEDLGGQLWMRDRASPEARAEFLAFEARRTAFRQLMRSTRSELQAVYAQRHGEAVLAQGKAEVLERFHQRYQDLKTSWGGFAGYDAWVSQANNALFAVHAAYDELVPGFVAMYQQAAAQHGEGEAAWSRFYAEALRLSHLPKTERHEALRALSGH